jgi:hypothetical protein
VLIKPLLFQAVITASLTTSPALQALSSNSRVRPRTVNQTTVRSASVITSNVLQRTFAIQYNGEIGTAFTIDIEGRQYLITAKHVVARISENAQIGIFNDGAFHMFGTKVVGLGIGAVDIAVLALSQQISATLPLPPISGSQLTVGQDLYFLGFPYAMGTDSSSINANYPFPFVKKAILSAFGLDRDGTSWFYLDGHNNKGFSGGPVVFSTPGGSEGLVVAGVVSGFFPWPEPITQNGKATSLSYNDNTGIMIAFDIRHAVDLIKANPIGFILPAPKK